MDKREFSARRRIWGGTMRGLMVLCTAVTCALAVFLIVYVLVKGVPNLSWQLLSTKPSYLDGSIGILPDIITTVCTVLTTLLVVLPLGVCAAVYLTEYAANKRVVAVIEYAAETLSGIPSIIYGLVGQMFFCQFLGMKKSLLAGAMTLVIMNLYVYAKEQGEFDVAFAIAAILMALALLINLAAMLTGRYFKKRRSL